jgi:hypothetical protein
MDESRKQKAHKEIQKSLLIRIDKRVLKPQNTAPIRQQLQNTL